VLDSEYSLLEDVKADELDAVGWMMLSMIGSPADGCVEDAAVFCPKSPPRKPRDELVSLSVLATYSLLEEIVEELDSENVG
jgi:hypothetical protein